MQPGDTAQTLLLRLPVILSAQSARLPGARGHRPRRSGPAPAGAERRSAYRLRTLFGLRRRRPPGRPQRSDRHLARGPRLFPDRFRHHLRHRAGTRRRADRERPLGAAHRLADRAGRPFPGRPHRHHALADPGPGHHSDPGHGTLPVQSRCADPYRRPRRHRCRPRQADVRGPVPALPPDRVPVFWACGVTPQAAAEAARLPLFITHAAAHSFITDRTADSVMLP